MPVLQYDTDKKCFWFEHTTAPLHVFKGSSIEMHNGKRRIIFEDITPKSIFNLKAFKAFFGKEGKATQVAADRIKELKADLDCDFLSKYAGEIEGRPYQHQLQTIEVMQHNDRYALLLEQGLGKTYISLMAMKIFKARDGYLRSLVLCPAIVFETWLAEIDKFTPEFKVLTYKGDLHTRLVVQARIDGGEEFDILLSTYDMLRDPGNKSQLVYRGLAWASMSDADRKLVAQTLFSEQPKIVKFLTKKTSAATWYQKCGKALGEVTKEKKAALMSVFPEIAKQISEFTEKTERIVKADHAEAFFNRLNLNVAVMDEASRLINPKSHTAKALEGLNTKRLYLMSGTLCVGRPTDMYMPMRILDKGIFPMNWWAFVNRYCITRAGNRHIIDGYKNVDELKERTLPYTINFTRDECLDLPDRTIITRYYSPGKEVLSYYNAIANADESTPVLYIKDSPVVCVLPIQKIQRCLQMLSGFLHIDDSVRMCDECDVDQIMECSAKDITPASKVCPRHRDIDRDKYIFDVDLGSNPKLAMLDEDLSNITPSEKVIIWVWYRYDYRRVEELLQRKKIPYITTNDKGCAQTFEADASIRVFLGQTAQGIGITLNSATTTIYYSHGTALEPRLQSMDRNMRIGQSKPVVVLDYVCRNSIEDKIVELLQHKDDVHAFIQKPIICGLCDNVSECRKAGIRKYRKGCLYDRSLKRAESRRTLKVVPLTPTEGDEE